jgi:threonine synthase
VTQAIYRCPSCHGLLEVRHDLEALKATSAEAWKKLFDDRYMTTEWPYGSGVWGKREWVMPQVPDDRIVSMCEGGSNLFWAERYGKQVGLDDVWVKLCGNSHSGSFKDLGMTVLVRVVRMAIEQGLEVKAIACASTGDTSAALAAYGAAAGLPVVVLLPRGKISTGQLVQPLAHEALVLGLDTDFDGCMAIVQKLAEEGVVYLANSMNALRIEGQKTVAIEVAAVRLAGTRLGSCRSGNPATPPRPRRIRDDARARRHHAISRLVMAQAENANPLYRAWSSGKREVEPIVAKPTQATAIQIGNPVSAPRAMRALEAMNGIVEQASEQELADAAARADRTGIYACPHTAVGLAVLEKLAARGTISRGERVVCISTANGLKFTEFKVRYHERAIAGDSTSEPARAASPDYAR